MVYAASRAAPSRSGPLSHSGALVPANLDKLFRISYSSHVKKASITEAKNNLSALIDSVQGGSPVLIVDRGRPVARLEPVRGVAGDDGGRLARLVREGIVRPSRGASARAVFANAPPRPRKGASGVRALLAERREGR